MRSRRSHSRVTLAKEHDRAERLLGAALAEQHRSSERYDAAVGGSARLLAAVALNAADQEVAARDAWLKWVDDDVAHPSHWLAARRRRGAAPPSEHL